MEPPKSFFYVAMRQNANGQNLNIRTSLGAESLTKELVREIHSFDTNLAPGEVITMQEQVDRTTAVQRIAVLMLAVFGGLALLLATIGLYGVLSYTVSQRSRELALRMALGADASNLLRLVMSGVDRGRCSARRFRRTVLNASDGKLLYKVSPRDPLAFGSAWVVMALAALAACFLPAWRAARTDPVQALRH